MSLKLYVDARYTSPYAMSAFVALTEKKLSFDVITVDLNKAEQYKADFPHISLTSRVPVLEHDGFYLSESSAIDEYIDETFPGLKLYPTSTKEKAKARQVQAWLRSDLMPIRVERSTEVIFYKPVTTPLTESAQQAAKKLFFIADELLQDGNQNLFGEWCIADTDLALMLNRLVLNGDPVPEKLAAYAKYQWQRPSVQEWVKKSRPT
jgi:glutathione S-transferase